MNVSSVESLPLIGEEDDWLECSDELTGRLSPPFSKVFSMENRKVLFVTDFSSMNWCELQFLFAKKYGRSTTQAMTEGLSKHTALELELHDVVELEVSCAEEQWGLRLVNIIFCFEELKLNKRTREIPVFGSIGNNVVVGIIDELDTSAILQDTKIHNHQQTTLLSIKDTKTRAKNYIPAMSDNTRVQLMLYYYLLHNLLSQPSVIDRIVDLQNLNRAFQFSENFLSTCNLEKNCTLESLIAKTKVIFSKSLFTLNKSLIVEYLHQGTSGKLGEHVVGYDEQWLLIRIERFLKIMSGESTPCGVEIEDAWKCQSCEFASVCCWRDEKAKEYVR